MTSESVLCTEVRPILRRATLPPSRYKEQQNWSRSESGMTPRWIHSRFLIMVTR